MRIFLTVALFLSAIVLHGRTVTTSPRDAERDRSMGKRLIKQFQIVFTNIPLPIVTNTLTLVWDYPPDTNNIDGVHVYDSTNSVDFNYLGMTAMGDANPTNFVVSYVAQRLRNIRHWFKARSFNLESDSESEDSNIVHWPKFPRIITGFDLIWPINMTVDIQQSEDLVVWTHLATVTGTNYTIDTILPQNFFRLSGNDPLPDLKIKVNTIPDPRDN